MPDRPFVDRRSPDVAEDGRITRIYAVRTPAKLGALDVEAVLSR